MDKAILLAPCVYSTTLGLENYKETFPVFRQQLNNVVNDPNWAYDVQTLCSNPDTQVACDNASTYAGEQMSVKSLELFD